MLFVMFEVMVKEFVVIVFYMCGEFYVMFFDYMKCSVVKWEYYYNNFNIEYIIFVIIIFFFSNFI